MLNRNKKGFTLIETIVAIGILTVALTSPMVLASSSIRASNNAKNKFIASYLASEGVEIVRNIRDQNAINPDPKVGWLDRLGSCKGGNGCEVDVVQKNASNCGKTCPFLTYNSKNGVYAYETGKGITETKFIRTVWIDEITADREAKVTVEVKYKGKILTTLRENIFNWR